MYLYLRLIVAGICGVIAGGVMFWSAFRFPDAGFEEFLWTGPIVAFLELALLVYSLWKITRSGGP